MSLQGNNYLGKEIHDSIIVFMFHFSFEAIDFVHVFGLMIAPLHIQSTWCEEKGMLLSGTVTSNCINKCRGTWYYMIY